MKKLFLLLVTLVFVSSFSFGQFSKGTILAGGNVGLDFDTNKTTTGSTTVTNYTSTSFNFNPQVGYFFIDNFAAGLGLQFNSYSTKQDGSASSFYSSTFAFSPFARYYYNKFYGQFGIGVGSYKNENTNNNNITSTTKGGVFNWSLAGGYAVLLNEHVALEPQIGYRYQSTSPDGSSSTNSTAGLFLQLGIQVYLHK